MDQDISDRPMISMNKSGHNLAMDEVIFHAQILK